MDPGKIIKRFIAFCGNIIDYRLGIIGAVFMGSVVGYINSDHGATLATIAAMKQAIYTFFVGGIIIKILDIIVNSIKNKTIAYFTAIISASILTIGMVYIVHSMKGTPKPFESTIPTIILAPPGYVYLAKLKRNNSEVELAAEE